VLDAGDELRIGESCERGEVGVHDVFIPRRFSGPRDGRRRAGRR
jgi:hypothetical protein